MPFDRHIHLDFENPCALCIELGPRCFTTTANIIDKGEQTCIERVKGKKTKCPNDSESFGSFFLPSLFWPIRGGTALGFGGERVVCGADSCSALRTRPPTFQAPSPACPSHPSQAPQERVLWLSAAGEGDQEGWKEGSSGGEVEYVLGFVFKSGWARS